MSTIDKITRLTHQNTEFDMELRKRLNVASANSVLSEDERINQIYEYCIEKIIKQQADEFYADFPLQSIKDILIGDFVRMESFRRKDNFGDFCLSLYQQIECMTNKLCEKKELSDITEKMWGYPAYLKIEKGKEPSIDSRSGDYTIASLLFPGNNRQSGNTNAFEKSRISLQTQYAIDKIRTIVYFLGYKATFSKIIPLKSLYYFKFLGVLAQYVEYIKEGWRYIPELKKYSESIEKQKISAPQPKVLGKIELKDDGKKRFK